MIFTNVKYTDEIWAASLEFKQSQEKSKA